MKTRSIITLSALALVAAIIFSCAEVNPLAVLSGELGDWATNENAEGTFSVYNYSSTDLLLYRDPGTSTSNILGVVPGNALDHKIINPVDGEYIVRAVSYDEVKTNGNDPTACRELYCNYIKVDGRIRILKISNAGGGGFVRFNNTNAVDAEIRLGNWVGQTVAYVEGGETNKVIYMPTGSYWFYPVFRVRSMDGSVRSLKGTLDDIIARSVDATGVTIDLTMPSSSKAAVGYVVLTNASDNGVMLMNGAQVLSTVYGLEIINPGDAGLYEVEGRDAGLAYSTFKIYRPTGAITLDAVTITNGHEYTYTLSSAGTVSLTVATN